MMSSGIYLPNRIPVVVTMPLPEVTQRTSVAIPDRSITIDQNGQHMTITDELLGLLGDQHGRILRAEDDERHGTTVSRSSRSLLRADDGARIPNAGLYPALQMAAQRRGYELRRRITPSLSALPSPGRTNWPRYPDIFQFIGEMPLGQIGIHAGVKIELLLADLALAYPTARIAALSKHRKQLSGLADRLGQRGIDSVSVSGRHTLPSIEDDSENSYPQVICSTPRAAADIDLAGTDIVIVLDAASCQHEDMNLALSQVDARFRLFGLFDVSRSYAPSSVDAMLATFGPEVIRLQEPGYIRRPVNYAFVATPHPLVHLNRDDRDFGVRCYWHHRRRNRRIKQLAIALRAGERLDVRKFGEVATAIDRADRPSPAVTILVERPVHAIELAKSLPAWPLIATDDDMRGHSGQFRNRAKRNRRSWQLGTHQIVTVDAAKSWRGDVTDVVIWAGGGQMADFLPYKWLRADVGTNKPLLIVDFDDQHNADAARMSGQRQRAYRTQDIFPAGISTSPGQLAMFLNRQAREAADAQR